MNVVRICASLAVFFIWMQLLFWARMFDQFAQYWDLIVMTIYEVKNFLIIVLVFVVMFQSGIYMLQINRIVSSQKDADQQLIFPFEDDDGLQSLWIASFINQYFLLLGDFGSVNIFRSSEGLEDKGQVHFENFLVLFFFMLSTFFTQIMILNMLIAIMMTTYEKITGDYKRSDQRQKLQLQAEFIGVVGRMRFLFQKICCCCKHKVDDKAQGGRSYLFVMRSKRVENEQVQDSSNSVVIGDPSNDFVNRMHSLENQLENRFRDMDNLFNKKILGTLEGLERNTMQRMQSIELGY